MSFWLGVFAGLTVWSAINVLLKLVYYGETIDIDRRGLFVSFALTLIFGLVSWYLATFGGMP